KIVQPSWTLTMVEGRERKAAFLREAARTLRLSNTEVANVRFENLSGFAGVGDLVTARAVRVDADLVTFSTSLLRPSGFVALFGATEIKMAGFDLIQTVDLKSSAVMTVLARVPRGTKHVDEDR